LNNWLKDVGNLAKDSMDSSHVRLLLQQLKIDKLLQQPSCNRNMEQYMPAINGWKKRIVYLFTLSAIILMWKNFYY